MTVTVSFIICLFLCSAFRYGLPIENLWISVYEKDEETYTIWNDEVDTIFGYWLFGLVLK